MTSLVLGDAGKSAAASLSARGRRETLASLMQPVVGMFAPTTTVAEATEGLRLQSRAGLITYLYVVDGSDRLLGLVVMREMLLAPSDAMLEDIMIRRPFALQRSMPLDDALKVALQKHYPVYPIVDHDYRLIGLVRGSDLFANRAVDLAAQAGEMVGVEKEERLSTPLLTSLKLRHPWLQINLLTALVAAAVVALFEDTLSRLVILAVFLPLMAGQTGKAGCQALAVALRGTTLGEANADSAKHLVRKEGLLGFANGLLVGLTAGAGMYTYALIQGQADPLRFGSVVLIAMVLACTVSGIAGALIPLTLKKLGADPATASSIFLTAMSDVASIGVFLGLATVLL